LPKENS